MRCKSCNCVLAAWPGEEAGESGPVVVDGWGTICRACATNLAEPVVASCHKAKRNPTTRDRAAAATGMSATTLRKVTQIMALAEEHPGLLDDILAALEKSGARVDGLLKKAKVRIALAAPPVAASEPSIICGDYCIISDVELRLHCEVDADRIHWVLVYDAPTGGAICHEVDADTALYLVTALLQRYGGCGVFPAAKHAVTEMVAAAWAAAPGQGD